MILHRSLLALIALVLIAPEVQAQEHVFSPGGRLRIEAPALFPGRVEGIVRDFTYQGVHLEEQTTGTAFLVPPAEIRYLAKFRGEDRRYMVKRRAAMLGFIVGSVGAVAGPGISIATGRHNFFATTAVTALSGVTIGAAGGAYWGSRHEGEVWREYRIIGQARARGSR